MTTLSRKIINMLWDRLDFGHAVVVVAVVDPEDGRYVRLLFPIEGSVACH